MPFIESQLLNFGRSSFQTHMIPSLVSFYTHFDHFFFLTLHLFSGATTKRWKESTGFPDPKLYAESFEKKISLTKSNILEARQTLIFSVQPSAAI